MTNTFTASKDFVLYKLLDLGPMSKRFGVLEQELPDVVELSEEFVRTNELDMDWMMAVERLLKGDILTRALARYEEVSEVLRLAIKKHQDEYCAMDYQTVEALQRHEKDVDAVWAVFSTAVATIFIEGAQEQGGWDFAWAQEVRPPAEKA